MSVKRRISFIGKQVQLTPIPGSYQYEKLPSTIGTIIGAYGKGQPIHPKTVQYCLELTEKDWQFHELVELENTQRTVVQTVDMEIIIFDVWPGDSPAMVLT
jgi:hypothetical protein